MPVKTSWHRYGTKLSPYVYSDILRSIDYGKQYSLRLCTHRGWAMARRRRPWAEWCRRVADAGASQWRETGGTTGTCDVSRVVVSSDSVLQTGPPPQSRRRRRYSCRAVHSSRGLETPYVVDARGAFACPGHPYCHHANGQYIGWQWRNFVHYLCQLVFVAILWVKLLEMFVTLILIKYALLAG